MKEEFEKLYDKLNEKNKSILQQIYKDAMIEKKKRRMLIIKYTVIPTIIIYIVQIILMFKKKMPNITLISWWTMLAVIVSVVIIKKNSINYIKYKRKIKNNIIFNLIKNFFNNVDYIPNKEISNEIYNEAGFKNYNRYYADDYIEAYIKQNEIIMSNVKTEIETTDSDGDSKTVVTFNGLFVKIKFNKSINDKIKICNYKYKNKENINLDSQDFEEMFDVSANDNIKVMQLLTSDVMELLIKFSKFINSKFDISIIENNIYIRIDNNISFEANLAENNIIDKKQMKKYYDTLHFVYNLSLYLIKWIEESYITE